MDLDALEQMLDSTISGYWDWHIQTGDTYLSPGFKKMLGYEDDELDNSVEAWQKIIYPEDLPILKEAYDKHVNSHGNSPYHAEVRFQHKNGSIVWIIRTGKVIEWDKEEKPLRMVGSHVNITDKKEVEKLRTLSQTILEKLAQKKEFKEIIEEVLVFIQNQLRIDSIGIRLKNSEDFPYIVSKGFDQQFLLTESSLLEKDISDSSCYEKDGKLSLECTCGLVLTGKTDPKNPLFTPYGSFVTNDSFPMLDIPESDDPRYNPRNNCIHAGFASILLVPIKVENATLGLLQLNAYRKNAFSQFALESIEDIATNLGAHLARIKTQEELQRSEAYNRMLFNNSVIGFAVCDMDGTLTDVNQTYADIIGRTIEECLSLSYWDITPKKFAPEEEEQLQNLTNKGYYGPYEKEYIHKDGHYVPIVLNGRIIEISGKKHIWSTVEDISKRKKAENELRTEKERLSTIFNNTNVGIWEWNVQSGEIEINKRWADIVGYTLDELAPTTIQMWEKLCHPEDLKRSKGLLEACFNNSSDIYECELRMRHKNGSWIWVLDRGNIVSLTAEGEPHIMMGTHLDITQRKVAEERLRESETVLTKFFDQPSNLHIIAGLDNRIIRINKGFENILGFPKEELLGSNFLALIHPDDVAQTTDVIQSLARGESASRFENRFRDIYGKYHLISWSALASIKDQKLYAIGNDITEKRRSEDDLKKSEELLRKIAENIPHSYLSIIEEGMIIGFTSGQEFTRQNLDPDQFIGLSIEDVFGEQSGIINEQYKRAFLGEEVEFELFTHEQYQLYRVIPLFDKEKNVERVLSVVENITNRRITEEQLRQKEEHLTELVAHIPSIIYSFSFPGGGVYYSPMAEEILGYSIQELLDTPFLWHDSIHPDDIKKVDEVIQKATEGIPFSIQYRIKNAQGEWLTFIDQSIAIKNENGIVTRIDGVVDDITKQLKASEEKKELTEQLHQSQKLEAIGQLAGGVAHDVNNTLAAIIGAAELISLDCLNREDTLKYAKEIVKIAYRSGDLTKKLLTFARKIPHHFELLNLHNLIADSIDMLKHTIDKKIDIHFKSTISSSPILGDSSLIQNALINIGINASHAMTDGGSLTLTLSEKSITKDTTNHSVTLNEGTYFCLTISDTGEGIPEELLIRIFDPFFTTKEKGKGTGLGLATVLGTIQDHGGDISVNSQVGKGTTFTLYLPKHREEQPVVQEEKEKPRPTGTILLIDDEPIIRNVGRELLSYSGYSVLTAENGQEGIALYQEKKEEIIAIILDLMMPVMDGRETLEKLREMDSKVPIIIASGFGSDEQLSRLNKLQYEKFLRKPYTKEVLMKTLAEILP